MGELILKQAYIESIEVLTKMRVKFVLDLKPNNESNITQEFYNETRAYIKRLLEEGRYIGILGSIDNETICTAGIMIYELPPLIENKNRFIGHILNFYTVPEHRRKGYGIKMMDFIKETASEKGIKRLFLNATNCGEPLYRKAGFYETKEKALVFDL